MSSKFVLTQVLQAGAISPKRCLSLFLATRLLHVIFRPLKKFSVYRQTYSFEFNSGIEEVSAKTIALSLNTIGDNRNLEIIYTVDNWATQRSMSNIIEMFTI